MRHPRDSYREHDGDDSNQAFRYSRDSKRNCEHEGVYHDIHAEMTCLDYSESKYEHADAKHQLCEDLRELSQLELKRRELLFCLRYSLGDLAHLGIHAGSRDNGLSSSVHNSAAHVYHVAAVTERDILCSGRKLDRFRLLGDRN